MNSGFAGRAGAKSPTKFKPRGANTGIWKLQLSLDKPVHGAPLTPATIDLDLHFPKKGSGEGMTVCNKMYFSLDDPDRFCEKCEELNRFGDKDRPSTYRLGLFYIFESVNQVYTNKKGEETPENPCKVVEMPAGGYKKPNFQLLNEKTEEESFMDEIWKFQIKEEDVINKKTGETNRRKVFQMPSTATLKTLKKLYDPEVPKEVTERFSSLTRGEALGLILASSGYANIQWEHPDIVSEGIVRPEPVESTKTETADEDPLD